MLKVFKNRILLIYISLVLTSFLLLDVALSRYLDRENVSHNVKIASVYLKTLDAAIKREKAATDVFRFLADDYFSRFGVRITFLDIKGRVLADSEISQDMLAGVENHLNRPEVVMAMDSGSGFSVRHSATLGKDMLYYAEKKNIGKIPFVLRAAIPLEKVNIEMYSARRKISAYFLIFMLASAAAGWLALKKAFYPLEKIIYASKRYASGDFSHRIPAEGAGEIKKLSETLNYMAENLEKQLGELEIKNNQLSIIFENMQEAVVLLDRENRIRQYNSKFSAIFSAAAENVKISELLRSGEALEAVDNARKTGERSDRDFIYTAGERHYRISVIPLCGSANAGSMIAVIYDIDEAKKLEALKKDFIANLSHEIKTPVTVIKTSIETVLSDPEMKKEDLKTFLSAIDKNTSRIENIARDIISLNYLESDLVKLKKEKINLFSYIQNIQESFRSYLASAKIKFSSEISREVFIEADRDILERAFFNLFDNAVKFNCENGFLRIKSLGEGHYIRIVFENSGPEIPAESLERIFERFYTADKSRSRLKGGTGLGLAIAKHAIVLHGGSIKAESFSGVNRFTVTLPS